MQVIQKQTQLFSARQLAEQIIIKAEGDAQQTLVRNQALFFEEICWSVGKDDTRGQRLKPTAVQADVAQYKYRQQVLAEGYSKALNFFSRSGQESTA